VSTLHLSLGDHVHKIDATQKDPCTAKSLESQHGSRASFNRPTVLLDNVVEIFGLADLDGFKPFFANRARCRVVMEPVRPVSVTTPPNALLILANSRCCDRLSLKMHYSDPS
jgi:hypothetical protein